MDLTKSFEFFNPYSVKYPIHIIGCGSIGSNLAELIARAGLTNIHLYDFDTIEAHNIANQAFTENDIGKSKVEATRDIMVAINHELSAEGCITMHPEGYIDQRLSGYVFLAVDNIDLRRDIVTKNKNNRSVKAMFDFRTRLIDAQHYAADWASPESIKKLLETMNFSHEEAHAATPTTACGVELGVAVTVQMACCVGFSNFVNFVCGKDPLKEEVCFISPFKADIW